MRAIPEDLRRRLEACGARISETREIEHATQYRIVRGSEESILNVYSTGKILEGGRASALRDLLREWRLSRAAPKSRAPAAVRPSPNPSPRIGTDEAGKGEYFGPLVVAGVRISGAEKDRQLREIGVRDSKSLDLRRVPEMAARIEEVLGSESLRVVSLSPPEYDRRRAAAGGNVNRLLGELNAEVINELENEVEVVVIDAFGEKARSYVEPRVAGDLRLEVRPRAEDDAAVAAASILARARYLEEMERLSESAGFELPRGAGRVLEAAVRVVEERGEEGLARVAKVHFATTQQVLESFREHGGKQ